MTYYPTKAYMKLKDPAFCALLAVIWGVILGLLILTLPPILSIALVGATIAVPLFLKRPELALLCILAISSSVLEEEFIPTLPVGPLELYATDVIAILIIIYLIFKKLIFKDFNFAKTPLNKFLMAFFVLAMFSTLISFLRSPGSELSFAAIFRDPPAIISLAIPEIRIVCYYLLFYLVINTVKSKSQAKVLAYGILFISMFVVFMLVAQELLGTSLQIIPGRVETLVTDKSAYIGITRVTGFSGEKILLLALTLITAMLVVERNRVQQITKLAIWVVIFAGVLITFSRSIWGGYAISMVLLLFVLKQKERERIIKLFVLLGIVILLIVGMIFLLHNDAIQTFIKSSLDRALTLVNPFTYQDPTSTFRWRDFEYQWASIKIKEYPLFGVGLGSYYRPWLPWIDWDNFDGRGFVHNAHIWIMVKTGLLGYAAFLLFSIMYVTRGIKNASKIKDDTLRAILYGSVFTYIGFFIGSITSPIFMLYSSTPVIGVMIGLSESIILINNDKELPVS